MTPRVRWVPYGRPAADALRGAIAAAKWEDPLTPVTVVVPSNPVGVGARRLLGSGALGPTGPRGVGLAAVTFSTVFRIGEVLGAPALAAAGRRPVSTPVIAAALRRALAERPGVFAPVADHPATEAALVATYRELRDVSPDALERVAATGRRAHDVVHLHRRARAFLEAGWYDEQDLLLAAEEHVDTLGAVIVYLPERLSRHAAALLSRCEQLVVVAGATGASAADAEVVDSLARLGADAPSPPPAPPIGRPGRTRLLTASDADDEVRSVVREVVAAVRSGTRLDRIAVLYGVDQPYARLLSERFAAAGITTNGAAVVPPSERLAGRTLLGLLRLPEVGYRRQEVFAWLSGAPVRFRGRSAPVGAWERLSREAGVVGGADWDVRLLRKAEELAADAAGVDDDEREWLADRLRWQATLAADLRTFVTGLMADVSRGPRGWADHARWAAGALDRLLGPPTQAWPLAEVRGMERVHRALDRLVALGEVEGPVEMSVFVRTLELELEDDLGRVGRIGEGVLIGPVAMGVGLDLDLVIVVGLAEGAFPAPARDDSLLPDIERAAAGGQLRLRGGGVGRQHRLLYAALAGGERQLLCVPRGDLRKSSERVPSRWALEIASTLAGRSLTSPEFLALDNAWMTHVASFDAGLRRTAPATAQEHRLRALAGGPIVDPVWTAAKAVVEQRRSDRFTRFDGSLAGLSVPAPAVTSATRLETWVKCPFAYFASTLLGVDPVDNPEDEIELTALRRGSLVHAALERFFDTVLASPPVPSQPWSAAERARMQAIGEAVCDEFEARGEVGRRLFWTRDRARILHDLDTFLTADEVYRAQLRTRPVATESAFGMPGGELGVVEVDLGDGKRISFRGKVDRVDVAEDGTIHVLDYKTGGRRDFESLSEEDPDRGGRKLQLPVYGAAARLLRAQPDAPVRADFWFVTPKGGYERRGYAVTEVVMQRFRERLRGIVFAIESGVFPNHPTAASSSPFVECEYCDPDHLGVVELRRQWDRKRQDLTLALYADMAEPVEGGDG